MKKMRTEDKVQLYIMSGVALLVICLIFAFVGVDQVDANHILKQRVSEYYTK